MRLSVRHTTFYAYDPPAERCTLRLRLFPPVYDAQRILSWAVTVNGAAIGPQLTSGFGVGHAIWACNSKISSVEVLAVGEVETKDAAGVVSGLRETARPGVFLRSTPLTQADARIIDMAESVASLNGLDRMHALSRAVYEAIAYRSGTTDARTTAAQALKLGAGVCQDHAQVFIAAARHLETPARYIVGYLLAEGAALTETHAWAEAYIPELGWVGFDATNQVCPTERYVRLSCGLDAAEAAPIRGNVSGLPVERLSASVDIGQTQQ